MKSELIVFLRMCFGNWEKIEENSTIGLVVALAIFLVHAYLIVFLNGGFDSKTQSLSMSI